MLTAIALFSLIIAAFWRVSLRLLAAGLLALLVIGGIQVSKFIDEIGLITPRDGSSATVIDDREGPRTP